jgi:ERCC4-related helicase
LLDFAPLLHMDLEEHNACGSHAWFLLMTVASSLHDLNALGMTASATQTPQFISNMVNIKDGIHFQSESSQLLQAPGFITF